MAKQGWFAEARDASPGRRIRLFCLPHAGAGASWFARWQRLAPALTICRVQCPGREERADEAAHTSMDSLVPALRDAILPRLDEPFAFYGHSNGALVAFELTHRLRDTGERLPLALVSGASPAPDALPARESISGLDDDQLIAALRSRALVPEALLSDRQFMRLVTPAIRGDFAMHETYVCRPRPPLPVPILTLAGTDDPLVRADGVARWRAHTTSHFEQSTVAGGHLFPRDQPEQTVSQVQSFVTRMASRR